MDNFDLLNKICTTPGAPGFEHRIRKLIIEEVTSLVDELSIDAMGNVIAIKKGETDKKVAVAAHMDEIAFIVTHIDEDGFVKFHTLGGFDPKTLTAQRVILHGKKDIIGVMGCKPIHIQSPDERNKAPKTSDYFIDLGLPKSEVEKYIQIGTPITRERELIRMGECINGKSLDNRISVFILIETLRALQGKTLPYDFYALFTVQEEIGLRGAMSVSHHVNPDFGIALDTTIAYDVPGALPHEVVTKLGKGAAIKIMDSMTICDSRMVRFLNELAVKHNIDNQLELLTAGGTDTAALQRSGKNGAIAGAISIPTRHIHTVVEMVHQHDVTCCIALLKAALEEINTFNWEH